MLHHIFQAHDRHSLDVELPILKEDAVTRNNNLVERQARLGALPPNEYVGSVSVS